jgi:hypothetical protein
MDFLPPGSEAIISARVPQTWLLGNSYSLEVVTFLVPGTEMLLLILGGAAWSLFLGIGAEGPFSLPLHPWLTIASKLLPTSGLAVTLFPLPCHRLPPDVLLFYLHRTFKTQIEQATSKVFLPLVF